LIAVNTDAHVLDHLTSIELGAATARRAWVEKAGVVNTWPAKELLAWVRSSRPEAGRRPATACGGRAKPLRG
jgi:histidinol phosphatase-like PHP family hydrolase